MIQQKVAKVKGVADVVFCIDFSGSMTPCINGVKEHIATFVRTLETASPNMKIDWRLAFCAYSDDRFIVKEFMTDAADFAESLGALETMGDEFTPGAIDFCITHFAWRPVSSKFIIVFTDENLEGGYSPDEVKERYPLLLRAIEDSQTRLFFFGPKCPYYEQLERVPRCMVTYLEGQDFGSVDFTVLLTSLGKTVSQSCGQQGGGAGSSRISIFDLSRVGIETV